MLMKECPRCGRLIEYGRKYCDRCAPIAQAAEEARQKESKKASSRRYREKQDPKYSRFYHSKEWKILSAKYSQDRSFRCEECGQIATDVHHVIPIQTEEGWNRRLDYDNLKLLCKKCHNRAHHRF